VTPAGQRRPVATSVALILAGPALVALGALILRANGPGAVVVLIQAIGWFGGPALMVIGVARLWSRRRWRLMPSTRAGRAAVSLAGGCSGFFVLFAVFLGLEIGPDERPEFVSNLYLAISLLAAGACAVASGMVAAFGILRRGERSALVIGCAVLGAVVAVFAIGEAIGHEPRPDSDDRPGPAHPVAGNSHTNLAARSAGNGAVEVSFDYAFNEDPEGWTTDSITVTALAGDQQPLDGHTPVVRAISRGTGHMDVVLRFSAAQMAQVQGFSVCFTGPGTPEPNPACAVILYTPD
jgi:hypothetical protein